MSGPAPEQNTAIVAEKPSVARDIARVVGASARGDGYLHGSGYVVTWAIGHLVHLAQPNEIRPEWKSWRRETLPMLPREWPLVVYDKTSDQFEVVRKILTSPKIGKVVCALTWAAGASPPSCLRFLCQKLVSAASHQTLRHLARRADYLTSPVAGVGERPPTADPTAGQGECFPSLREAAGGSPTGRAKTRRRSGAISGVPPPL